MKHLLLLLVFLLSTQIIAQNQHFIKVHFLYGSKPAPGSKLYEPKWFGGMLGGHVGIEIDSNQILNFLPDGKFHYFAKKNKKHSRFDIHTEEDFYAILGGASNEVKKLAIMIPITNKQKLLLDSIANAYLNETPYDYAFVGMRCGAAAYDILAQIGIVKNYSRSKTVRKIFYPRKLRKRLIRKARRNGWRTFRQNGSNSRVWEEDKVYKKMLPRKYR